MENYKEIFIQAYDEHADAIFRYCLFRVYDREKAKDLMQETFTKTWEYMASGNLVVNVRAFLYKVAHNTCVNEIVRHKAYSLDEMQESAGFDPVDLDSPSQSDEVEIRMLLDKMHQLHPSEKELLTLRYIDDLKVSEIAKLLNKLPNTISVKISRAEESLKNLYKENGKQF